MKYELYQFKHGDKAWNFTSHRKLIEHDSIKYYPIRGLQRTDIEDESIDKCDTDIILPQLNLINDEGDNLTQLFINKIYYGGVTVTILELRDGETLVLHKGRVTQPKFDEDADTMTLVCSTAESYFNTNMLVRKFQKPCANNIYDFFCGLKIEDWAIEVTVFGINGLNVSFTVNPTQVVDEEGNLVFEQVPLLDENEQPVLDENNQPVMVDGDPVMETKTYPDGWLSMGLLVKSGVHTLITSSSANAINLYRVHQGLKAGDVVIVVPGCDQSLKTCYAKFKNNYRFAGHPNIPNKNPLEVQLIR